MGKYKKLQKDPYFTDFTDFLHYIRRRSICEDEPDVCKPREIDHVVWDADDTIWDISPISLASLCKGPYKTVDENTLIGNLPRDTAAALKTPGAPCTIRLKPELRDTLDLLGDRDITSSIASMNRPDSVIEIIEAFKLDTEFNPVKASLGESKAEMIQKTLAAKHIKPHNTIFIDDDAFNLNDVYYALGVLPLQMGVDILSPKEVFRYILTEEEGGR